MQAAINTGCCVPTAVHSCAAPGKRSARPACACSKGLPAACGGAGKPELGPDEHPTPPKTAKPGTPRVPRGQALLAAGTGNFNAVVPRASHATLCTQLAPAELQCLYAVNLQSAGAGL